MIFPKNIQISQYIVCSKYKSSEFFFTNPPTFRTAPIIIVYINYIGEKLLGPKNYEQKFTQQYTTSKFCDFISTLSLRTSNIIPLQMAPVALVPNLVIRWHHLHQLHLHCHIALPWSALLALSVGIELESLSARVTSFKFPKGLLLTHSLSEWQTLHYWLRGKWIKKVQKICKSRPLFLIQ